MAGALDALAVGTALMDGEGYVLACCERFAALVGRPVNEVIGVRGRDLAHAEDRAAARWLMANMWKTGESFTTVVRRADGNAPLLESHVQRLYGGERPLAVSIIRPFEPRPVAGPTDVGMAEGASGYVVDMTKQMARLAGHALMPVTSDLLVASARAAEREAGLAEVGETPA